MPALWATNGYGVILTWSNVTRGNPAVVLYQAYSPNGGAGYLSDTNIAEAQIVAGLDHRNLGYEFARLTNGGIFTLPDNYFTNNASKYFLFEGAGTGSGQLVLTITQNATNTIAQTGAWLDLHDIKEFYEAVVITNNMSGAKSNWTSAIDIVQPARFAFGDDTNLIVLVHGINVRTWDCINDAETVYKRLYWAGFHGRFAEVKWPCNLLTPIPSPLTPSVFNLSELQAYKASTAMATYLNQLRTRFPGYRLNLLVHSQGNPMVSEAIRQSGAPFDTYILTQGAMPDSGYDMNAPTNGNMAAFEIPWPTPESQPMGYHGIYTNLPGQIVNFYNPLDKVLGYWVDDQKYLKPSAYFDTSSYSYDGTNSHFVPFIGAVTSSPTRRNRARWSRAPGRTQLDARVQPPATVLYSRPLT